MTGTFTVRRKYNGIEMVMLAYWRGAGPYRVHSIIPREVCMKIKNLGRTLDYFLLDGCMEIRGELNG